MRKLIIFALLTAFLALIIPNTFAALPNGHIYLLAVSSEGENETGSVADLYLEIKPGSGRVFLDTYPLTKVDTQFSTRLANSIACDYAEVDCQSLDFFYTIKSRSTIVGGPSAGAAITILTATMLMDESLPDNFAVTGTINSGGLVGPIAGIRAKVQAAEDIGLKEVLMPAINVDNNTQVEDFLNSTTIKVVKIASLDDAIYELTGKRKYKDIPLEVNPVFNDIMREIAESLCDATRKIMINGTNTTEEKKGTELYEQAVNASNENSYYSEASFCFGANVQFRILDLRNKSNDDLLATLKVLKVDIDKFESDVDNIPINTIDDLQTYMIVKERINEANSYLDEVLTSGNFSNISSTSLAYSIERYNSAITWTKFFGTGKKEYILDNDALRTACVNKITEVSGYLQYILLYINIPLSGIQDNIDEASNDLAKGDYALCLSKASEAKAQSSLIFESLSTTHDELTSLLDQKIKIAKQSIIAQQEKGVFPILGYSYYEYAKTLKDSDADSALIYIGYSIEISNLDVYFPKINKNTTIINIGYKAIGLFLLGVLVGIIMMIGIMWIRLKNPRNRIKSRIRVSHSKRFSR